MAKCDKSQGVMATMEKIRVIKLIAQKHFGTGRVN